jgi:predicted TIM-barrel fold metal-dependent hydrolase
MPKPFAIIDVHSHVYPDKIAEKATQSVGDFYNVKMSGDGSVAGYLQNQAEAKISDSIIQSVALRPENVTVINDFIAKQAASHPTLIGFATMHPDFADVEAEVERVVAMGLKGFKVHPDSQQVNADDPRMMRLYAAIAGRLSLTIHAGDYRYDYSHPRRIREILHCFPDLAMNAAHFGGWSLYDLAIEFLEDQRCFMDVSSAQSWLGTRRTRELIDIYGSDRILFGSDFPMATATQELARFEANLLDDRVRERILHRNAEAFLGFDLMA